MAKRTQYVYDPSTGGMVERSQRAADQIVFPEAVEAFSGGPDNLEHLLEQPKPTKQVFKIGPDGQAVEITPKGPSASVSAPIEIKERDGIKRTFGADGAEVAPKSTAASAPVDIHSRDGIKRTFKADGTEITPGVKAPQAPKPAPAPTTETKLADAAKKLALVDKVKTSFATSATWGKGVKTAGAVVGVGAMGHGLYGAIANSSVADEQGNKQRSWTKTLGYGAEAAAGAAVTWLSLFKQLGVAAAKVAR